ncbi:MAG TPA: hypothetical protein VFA45_01935 [Actinomycetes bacterium]|nr:hypothetical protein [Actinomycetes bacterium]
MKRIAGTAIRHHQRVARHEDPTAARTAAIRQAITVHAADARRQIDADGDPRPGASEVHVIAEATIDRYSAYVHERHLAPEQAWSRTVQEVLAQRAPPGLGPASWWLHEHIQEEVGTGAQRGEVTTVLADYNKEDGWLGRVPVREARAVDAAIQHDAHQPTRRLRGQVAAAAQVLEQRPSDPALPLRDAGEFVARLRRLQTDLEQRSLARGRRRDPAVDYERGLAQIARRLQVANRQVADLEAAQRLGREWQDAHAPELARAEAAALTLRARELMLTARLEAYRPAWLLDGVGPAPAEPTRRVRWRQGVLAVLRWRVDHDVVDQRRPLGPEPTDLGELRRYRQAVEQVSGIARSIGHTPVLDSGRSRGRLGEDAGRPPPPLPGRPGIALERDVAEGVGIELP